MDESLELRTHTGLWRVEKKLYKLYDYTLPMPVSLRQAGTAIAVGVPWFMIMSLLGVKFGPPFGHLIWLAPPALLTWYANRPIMEGKRLMELIISQFTYLFQPSTYARLRPFRNNLTHPVFVRVWHQGEAPRRTPPAPEIQSLTVLSVEASTESTSEPDSVR